ncbi:methionyl-tRNA formyltransferase [Synchytrium microbalum]|uniref:Methionyl-tRNA formyltransferase, mitochondrial n=1 Tax=Synchytrium microbalum TaxID=1806994 RepID=A0A507CAU7_9FUNG|nr:methionyl-tRNA formyltransferase [Synchytrium microbalum]TPX38187.1 methionyl-tRNA formyltransferase [Synchytrium microbalum]
MRLLRSFSTQARRPPYSVLFFGTDEFSAITLKRLLERPDVIRHVELVCPPDSTRTKIQQCAAKTFAESAGVKIHHAPPKTLKGWDIPTASDTNQSFDIGLVVSFGYFITKKVLSSLPLRAVNVHPSLLPRYRGAAPIQHSILNGETETGVSIIELHEEKFDAGRLLRQAQLAIPLNVHYDQLHDQLAELGAQELISTLEDFPNHLLNAKLQDEALVSHAPKIQKSQAHVQWSQMSSHNVFRLYRAMGSKIPVYTTYRGKRAQLITLLDPVITSFPSSLNRNAPPGTLVIDSSKADPVLFIRCSNDWIGCTRLHIQDKKEVNIQQFKNGYQVLNFKEAFGL